MPEDEFAMIMKAMSENMGVTLTLTLTLTLLMKAMSENVGVYECPNGHKYTVGNCTMTRISTKCPDCGATIGNNPNAGIHTLAGGNKLVGVSKNDAWGRGNTKILGPDRFQTLTVTPNPNP